MATIVPFYNSKYLKLGNSVFSYMIGIQHVVIFDTNIIPFYYLIDMPKII